MSPRKRKEEPVPAATQGNLPMNGTAMPTIDLKALQAKAVEWAKECGLTGKIEAQEVEKKDFPQHGFGFVIRVHELDGQQRSGTTQFTSEGERNLWSMDGKGSLV
jgi:hypothetical protein